MDLYPNDRERLTEILSGRISFEHAERTLYSHDVSNPPGLVKLLVKSMPDAVCWPETPGEIAALFAWARERKVALTPRGGGTAGYGGSMPVSGGIVIDLLRFSGNLAADAEGMTATIDAGMTFLEAERRLNHQGLALRTYPTSAPAATVGGWVAQGGAGVGALQYGSVRDDLVSVELVLPSGDLRTFAGSELDVVEGLEGTTGIITRVTLKVRENAAMHPAVATFPNLTAFHKGLAALVTLPLWNVTFHNPEFAALRQEVTGRKNIPEDQWSAICVMEEGRKAEVVPKLKEAVEAAGGKLLDDKKSADEWGNRFKVFESKRLGPSMIPGEVVLPVARIGPALSDIRGRVASADFSLEGIVTRSGECICFAFALDDERRPQYSGAFGPAVVLLSRGKKHGGRAFGSGVYLSGEAPRVLGARLSRARAFKRTVDPANVVNPGKVFGTPVRPLTALFGERLPLPNLAQVLKPGEPLLAATQGLVRYRRPTKGRLAGAALAKAVGKAAAGDWGSTYAWESLACVTCNYCRTVCPAWQAERRESMGAAGWVYWTKDYAKGRGSYTPWMVEHLAACSDCGACDAACQVDIPISSMLRDLKQQLVGVEGFEAPGPVAAAAANVAAKGNRFGREGKGRTAWLAAEALPDKGEVLLWCDDAEAYARPTAAQAALHLLRAAGAKVAHAGAAEQSLAADAISAGLLHVVRPVVVKNLDVIAKSGAKSVLVLDPHAAKVANRAYAAVAAEEGKPFTAKFEWIGAWLAANAARLGVGKAPLKAMWAGSAAARAIGAAGVESWVLGLASGGVATWRSGEWAPDLNTGAWAHLAHPETAAKQARERLAEAVDAGAAIVVAASPSDAAVLEAASGDFEAPLEILTVAEFVEKVRKQAPVPPVAPQPVGAAAHAPTAAGHAPPSPSARPTAPAKGPPGGVAPAAH